MSKDKYDSRVDILAEKFARSHFADRFTSFLETQTWESLDDYEKKPIISSYRNLAKMAISAQADEIKTVWAFTVFLRDSWPSSKVLAECEKYLTIHGFEPNN